MHVLFFTASLLDFGTDCPDGKYILPVHFLPYNSAKHEFEVCKHIQANLGCACAAWSTFRAHLASYSFARSLASVVNRKMDSMALKHIVHSLQFRFHDRTIQLREPQTSAAAT